MLGISDKYIKYNCQHTNDFLSALFILSFSFLSLSMYICPCAGDETATVIVSKVKSVGLLKRRGLLSSEKKIHKQWRSHSFCAFGSKTTF